MYSTGRKMPVHTSYVTQSAVFFASGCENRKASSNCANGNAFRVKRQRVLGKLE